MDLNSLPNLFDYMNRRLADGAIDTEERTHIENFMLDERPPQKGIDLYAKRLKKQAIKELDDWVNRHKDFTAEEINLGVTETEQPWTFRADNAINRLRNIEPSLYLIRVENADWLCDSIGISSSDLKAQIEAFQKGETKAKDFLNGVVKRWNPERDKRPIFATTELEVEDIIHEDAPDDWAEQLRDRLGLGHYSPLSGRPNEIVLMRYTVQDVLDSLAGEGYPAIPTVLDSGMSPYFFPSPIPMHNNSYYGHTVNLALVNTENDYSMGVELLHPRIDYKPEHFFKMGVIARPYKMPLQRARRFHLPWLRLNSERDDFGTHLFGDK